MGMLKVCISKASVNGLYVMTPRETSSVHATTSGLEFYSISN